MLIVFFEGLMYLMAEMMVYAFAGLIELGIYACLVPPEKRPMKPAQEREPETWVAKAWAWTALTCAAGGVVGVLVTSVWR